MRTANEFLTTFIGSGHVDTRKILEQDNINLNINPTRRYVISYHEFIRAIIYKDNSYYYPDATQIVNLFDLTQVDFKEHFILPTILDFFSRSSSKGENEGFRGSQSLVKYLQDLGFNSDQIETAIIRSLSKDLIEAEGRKKPSFGDPLPTNLRLTTVGSYHIHKLIGTFVYVDAVVIDVPILDDTARKDILDEEYIHQRLIRAENFCKYLDTAWAASHTLVAGFSWAGVSDAIKRDIAKIQGVIPPRTNRIRG